MEPQVIKMYAAREQIYPREAKGRYATWRWVCVWLTQLAFYGLPWLTWNGRQALLFDLTTRKFYIFGVVLWPQDFIYLAALLIICAYLLFLVTAIAAGTLAGPSMALAPLVSGMVVNGVVIDSAALVAGTVLATRARAVTELLMKDKPSKFTAKTKWLPYMAFNCP